MRGFAEASGLRRSSARETPGRERRGGAERERHRPSRERVVSKEEKSKVESDFCLFCGVFALSRFSRNSGRCTSKEWQAAASVTRSEAGAQTRKGSRPGRLREVRGRLRRGRGRERQRVLRRGRVSDVGCQKSSGAAGTAGTSGSVTPGRSDAKTSLRARSLPPAPAPGRSRRPPRVGELVGDAVRSREPTDGPVPALPSPPETHTQIIPCRNCYACARCWIRPGNARARAPRASKRATRARGVPRVSRARDTIGNPGGDAR